MHLTLIKMFDELNFHRDTFFVSIYQQLLRDIQLKLLPSVKNHFDECFLSPFYMEKEEKRFCY